MFLTLSLVIGVITSAFSIIIALSMFFLVLWQSRSRRDNQIMAFFMGTVMMWGFMSGLFRFSTIIEQVYSYALQLTGSFMILNALAFFALAAYYASVGKKVWVRASIAVGLLLSFSLAILSINRPFLAEVIKPVGEPIEVTILPAGLIPLITSITYYTTGLILLWRDNHESTGSLRIGGGLVLIGILITPLISQFFPFVSPVDFAALASIFFARSILQRNLFAPLAGLNQQLTESESRYRVVSNLTSDYAYSVYLGNPLKVEWITDAFTRVTGYSVADLEALDDWKELIYPDDRPLALRRDRMLATGKSVTIEYRLISKHGEARWIRDHIQPLMVNGRLHKIVGAGRDIHERVMAEQTIRESEEKHKLLLDNLVPPVLALRHDMTIFYYNKAYANLMNVEEKTLEGQNLIELFPIFKQTQSYKAYQTAMATGEVQEVTGRFGEHHWLARISPTPWGILSVAEDITARIQAEEAQAMSRMKSELLAKVSHELRTPLGAILGYTDMLSAGRGGNLSNRHVGIVDRITINTEKLLGLVNGMLEQVQIELGEIRLQNTPFAPQKLLTNLHAILDVLATNRALTLSSQVDPNLPQLMYGDFQRLQQILVNLAGNGLKFTRQGSVHVGLNCLANGKWEIKVKDTGVGIPLGKQTYIFEPFHQIDFSQTREYAGVGLGLAIVKQLVELMEGEIRVDSEPGRGSTFTVHLPLQTE